MPEMPYKWNYAVRHRPDSVSKTPLHAHFGCLAFKHCLSRLTLLHLSLFESFAVFQKRLSASSPLAGDDFQPQRKSSQCAPHSQITAESSEPRLRYYEY